MIKRLVVGVMILAVSGCGLFADKYGVKITKEEQETEYSSVSAEIIEFNGFKNKEYLSELNLSLQKEIEEAITAFDALALDVKDDLPNGIKSVLTVKQNVKRNSKKIISFVTEQYVYTGGAHGTTLWLPKNINVVSENPHNLKLGELFCDDNYIEKLNVQIARMVKDDPEKYSELWAKPKISKDNEDRFYITDSDIVIYFPPYELSYYAKGFIEFPISFETLNPILKEEYRVQKSKASGNT